MIISISNFVEGIDFNVEVYDDNFMSVIGGDEKEIINDRNIIFKFESSLVSAIPKAYIGIKHADQSYVSTYILKIYGSDEQKY